MYYQISREFITKSTNDGNCIISGYASVYNKVDQDNDVITKGAFCLAYSQKVKLLWQHDQSKPIGAIKFLSEDDYGLKMEAVINGKTTNGKEAIELLQQKALNGLSVGFNIESFKYNGLGQRVITKAALIEISIVTFPANEYAQIDHVSDNNLKGAKMEQLHLATKDAGDITQKIMAKISNLEEKMQDIQTILARPENEFTENLEYKSAFNDYIRKGIQGACITKAFNSNQGDGGVLITPTLDSKIVSEMLALSPMRQLAAIETISTNALDVVIEDGRFASGWVGDAEAREETNTSKLNLKKIAIYELYAQPKATQRLIDDSAINLDSWLSERLIDSFVRAENAAFINGDGDKKPRGILSYAEDIEKQEAETISTDLLLDLISSLDEHYLANATFLMNRSTLAEIQKLKDENGRFIWQPSLSDSLKQTIFGIPVVCCSEMPQVAKDSISIALGDFKAAYKIVDRSGVNIMRDPYTDKPFVKFYAVKRVGGDLVNANAIKLAKITAEE